MNIKIFSLIVVGFLVATMGGAFVVKQSLKTPNATEKQNNIATLPEVQNLPEADNTSEKIYVNDQYKFSLLLPRNMKVNDQGEHIITEDQNGVEVFRISISANENNINLKTLEESERCNAPGDICFSSGPTTVDGVEAIKIYDYQNNNAVREILFLKNKTIFRFVNDNIFSENAQEKSSMLVKIISTFKFVK